MSEHSISGQPVALALSSVSKPRRFRHRPGIPYTRGTIFLIEPGTSVRVSAFRSRLHLRISYRSHILFYTTHLSRSCLYRSCTEWIVTVHRELASKPTRMKRIGKKPTSNHLLHTDQSNGYGTRHRRQEKVGVHACSTAESNIGIHHILPLLGLCCGYVGDCPYSLAGLAKNAGSKASFGSNALYDDRLLDKLLATDGCFFNIGCAVKPPPSDRVDESGERGFPVCNGVNPAFMLKVLLCPCELPCLGDCDTEIDGTDTRGE